MSLRTSATSKQQSERDMSRLEYNTDSVQSLMMDSGDRDTERIVEESPNRRYAKVTAINKMNQVLGKGAYKIVYKAIDREEGYEVAWNTCQVESFN